MDNAARIILVAEDYDDARFLFRFMLEREGYQVIEAADGVQAIELAKQTRPDLILMDISMPELDGIEATRQIRHTIGLADVPILVVTAHSDTHREAALDAGCNQVISKPVNFNLLKPLLTEYLEQEK